MFEIVHAKSECLIVLADICPKCGGILIATISNSSRISAAYGNWVEEEHHLTITHQPSDIICQLGKVVYDNKYQYFVRFNQKYKAYREYRDAGVATSEVLNECITRMSKQPTGSGAIPTQLRTQI